MDDNKQCEKALDKIDVNSPDFYNSLENEIENDQARMKKCLEVLKKLRMTAAETEVETAALYHAELWYDIEQLRIQIDKNTEDLRQDTVDMKITND